MPLAGDTQLDGGVGILRARFAAVGALGFQMGALLSLRGGWVRSIGTRRDREKLRARMRCSPLCEKVRALRRPACSSAWPAAGEALRRPPPSGPFTSESTSL